MATAAAEATCLNVMGPYIAPFAGNGPKARGADGLATDQSSLNYSFDYRGSHFVLLASDPAGRDWSLPTKWIASDLAAARTRHARHISVVNQASINYFGYTAVTVTGHRAIVCSFGRDIPAAGYLVSSVAYPTTLRDVADIGTQHRRGDGDEHADHEDR